uniref:Striatin N-terminal domain-containing protein n=1 Tax=Ciona savignyi TaxID=51511 RepID=H2ZDP0_CIOSA
MMDLENGDAGGNNQANEPGETKSPYSMPGILHFIQHEWSRFEMERAQWDVEKAELQARIAFLQGERKGQENLKRDLIRRIKMLEFALKQERAKVHKLKFGTDLSVEQKHNESNGKCDFPSTVSKTNELQTTNAHMSWRHGRQLLRQYLQEVGYSETILDVRSQRVRALLGNNYDAPKPVENDNQVVNGNISDEEKQSNQAIYDSVITIIYSMFQLLPSVQIVILPDFNFLNAEDNDNEDDEDVNMQDEDVTDDGDHQRKARAKVSSLFLLLRLYESIENALGLGALAGLTVANEADPLSYDVITEFSTMDFQIAATKESYRKTWNPKYTLRSHFDGIRAIRFLPNESAVITASEDHTMKLWNLNKPLPSKKTQSLDVEPIYSFRGHSGAVLSLEVDADGSYCFSGGLDASVRVWSIPSVEIDAYDTYDPAVIQKVLVGHTDAVWSLSYSSTRQQLLSASSDCSVRLWNPTSNDPLIQTYTTEGIPTSVCFVQCDSNHAVVSHTDGKINLYDLETGQISLVLAEGDGSKYIDCSVNCVASHPTMPITMTAHDDKHIKFFDNSSGKLIHSMVAHLDSVTSLSVDPNGLYLLSGSHDCSIRLWNLDSKTCIQELTSHRKKFDESIYSVAFHPSATYIASAGADALAKIFV